MLGAYKPVLKAAEAALGNSSYLWECVCDWQLLQVPFFSQMHCRCNYCTGGIVNSCLFFIFLVSMQSILASSPLRSLFVVTCHIQMCFAPSDFN